MAEALAQGSVYDMTQPPFTPNFGRIEHGEDIEGVLAGAEVVVEGEVNSHHNCRRVSFARQRAFTKTDGTEREKCSFLLVFPGEYWLTGARVHGALGVSCDAAR